MIDKKVSESSPADPGGLIMPSWFNNETTIKEIYMKNYPAAKKYILLNKGTDEQAKDIYQEAFIAMWRNIRLNRFESRNEHSLKSYLLQIVKNKWIDHLRSAQYRNTVLLNDSDVENNIEEPSPEEQERISLIKRHFKDLGDTCKEVLQRFYYNKESLRAIAGIFNWTEATARNNKYRCIERLRKSLQQNQYLDSK
ncbi:MAG TPA: sigma-70 family RNA polymerase sigma factor [Flavitalea sp.]|nr:sigma-70 family RNA polymerase sigma factor [Flavitalea sp.]